MSHENPLPTGKAVLEMEEARISALRKKKIEQLLKKSVQMIKLREDQSALASRQVASLKTIQIEMVKAYDTDSTDKSVWMNFERQLSKIEINSLGAGPVRARCSGPDEDDETF